MTMPALLSLLIFAWIPQPDDAHAAPAWIAALSNPVRREEAEFRLHALGPAMGAHLRDAVRARLKAGQDCTAELRAIVVLAPLAIPAGAALTEVLAQRPPREQAIASLAYLALVPHLDEAVCVAIDRSLVDLFTRWEEKLETRPDGERFLDGEYIAVLQSSRDAALNRRPSMTLPRDELQNRLRRNIHDVRIAVAFEVLTSDSFTDDQRRALLADALGRGLAEPHHLVSESRCADGFEWRISQMMLARWPSSGDGLDEAGEQCWRALALTHPNAWFRADAVEHLGLARTEASLSALARALHDPSRRVVLAAIASVGRHPKWYRAGGALQNLYLFSEDREIGEAARSTYTRLSNGR